MSNEELNNIIEKCKIKGFNTRVRDISYVLLCNNFDDIKTAYASVFGVISSDNEVNEYDKSKMIVYLKKELRPKKDEDISFEENKAYMLKLKRETEKAMKAGEIDKKDALKILSDISTKLNDKFSVKDNNIQQYVVVNEKYADGDICPYCQHEVSRRPISKEEAMKMYNLVEKI